MKFFKDELKKIRAFVFDVDGLFEAIIPYTKTL